MVWLEIKTCKNNAVIPKYQTEGSAGFDLHSCMEATIKPSHVVKFPTGIIVAIQKGYMGQVVSRSGLAIKQGITVVNSPGIIDSDYRGEIVVGLYNSSIVPYKVSYGDRIAQMIIVPYAECVIKQVDNLPETVRGTGGLGSSGV